MQAFIVDFGQTKIDAKVSIIRLIHLTRGV